MRLAVVQVDVAAIESGRSMTSQENFRPVWMDIGGGGSSGGGKCQSANGGSSMTGAVASATAESSTLNAQRTTSTTEGVGGSGRVGTGARGAVAAAAARGRGVATGERKGKGGDGGSDAGEEIYLARVNWLQDGSLCAQVQNRAQTELRLLRLDPGSGTPTVLVVERSKVWINLHHLLRSLPSPAPQVGERGGVPKSWNKCAFHANFSAKS